MPLSSIPGQIQGSRCPFHRTYTSLPCARPPVAPPIEYAPLNEKKNTHRIQADLRSYCAIQYASLISEILSLFQALPASESFWGLRLRTFSSLAPVFLRLPDPRIRNLLHLDGSFKFLQPPESASTAVSWKELVEPRCTTGVVDNQATAEPRGSLKVQPSDTNVRYINFLFLIMRDE